MNSTYTVRILGSDGIYPASPLILDDIGVLAADDIAWSAVHSAGLDDSDSARPGCFAGAISWLTPDEILFFASVSLAEPHPRANGRLRPYTDGYSQTLELEQPVERSVLIHESRELALKALDAHEATTPFLGQRFGKPETIARDYAEAVEKILRAVDTSDPLLFRGLYKFHMAGELQRFPQFLEESALAALISREAVLELLRRKLSTESGKRFKRDHVLEHIRTTFPTGDPFVDVLETDWEVRVMITHPASEYGEHWSPPVEPEECFDALHSLTYLYRYYLLGEPWIPAEFD